jgi:hypothetical protein
VLASITAVSALAVAFVAYVLWPRWPDVQPAQDAPTLPITIGGVTFNVPPASIRIAVQRRPGAQERIDLAFVWPSLAPPPPAIKPAPGVTPEVADKVFVTVAAHGNTLSPAERLKVIYPRYIDEAPSTGGEGLATVKFRAESPYQGEDLFYEASTPERFSVRCTRPVKLTPGTCLHERRIDGADLTVRFPRDWLADWRAVAHGIDELVAKLKQAGN